MRPRAILGIALQAAAALLLLPGCDTEAPAAGPPVGHAELATVVVGTSDAPGVLVLDGVVEAVDQATLSAQTSGRVSEVLVEVDDAVQKGQVLLRLRATEQVSALREARAALTAATSREAQARAQHDRIRDMYERKVVARATYDMVHRKLPGDDLRVALQDAASCPAPEQPSRDRTSWRGPASRWRPVPRRIRTCGMRSSGMP